MVAAFRSTSTPHFGNGREGCACVRSRSSRVGCCPFESEGAWVVPLQFFFPSGRFLVRWLLYMILNHRTSDPLPFFPITTPNLPALIIYTNMKYSTSVSSSRRKSRKAHFGSHSEARRTLMSSNLWLAASQPSAVATRYGGCEVNKSEQGSACAQQASRAYCKSPGRVLSHSVTQPS